MTRQTTLIRSDYALGVGSTTGSRRGLVIAKFTGAEYGWRDAAVDAALGAAGVGIVDKLNDIRRAASGVDRAVTVSRSRFSEAAAHIDDAQAAGKPARLTIDRAGRTARRADAMKGTRPRSGLDRDEYPPAMFREGGKGSSVRHINPQHNRGAGACIGAQCRGLPEGAKVTIETVPE